MRPCTATMCRDMLSAADEPVPVKRFRMVVLLKLEAREPDMKREDQLPIEQQMR